MGQSKAGALHGFLGTLSPSSATTLVAAVEQGRLEGHSDLPHELILEAIRPALQRADRVVRRTPTPLRVFCQPFEDLLGVGHDAQKHKGRIRRSSIIPIWDWLANDLMPDRMVLLCDTVVEALRSGDARRIRDAATQLHGVTAMTLGKALRNVRPGSADYARLVDKLGDEIVIEDARDIAMVLDLAVDILALTDVLPNPIQVLEDEHIEEVRASYEAIVEHMPDHAPYIIFMVMGRLAKPWQTLRLLGRLTNRSTDTLVAQSDLGTCGSLLFADLDQSVAFFEALDISRADLRDVHHQLSYYVSLSQGITAEMNITRDGDWGTLLSHSKARIAEKMEGVLKRVLSEIRWAVPMKGTAVFGAGSPDLSVVPDAAQHAAAVDAVTFLADIRYLAEPAAFAGPYLNLVTEIQEALEAYIGEVMAELRTASVDIRPLVEAHVQLALDLCRGLMEADQADIWSRKVDLARKEAV